MTSSSLSHSLFDTLFHDAWHGLTRALISAPAPRYNPYNDSDVARLPAHLIQDIGLDPHRVAAPHDAEAYSALLTHRA